MERVQCERWSLQRWLGARSSCEKSVKRLEGLNILGTAISRFCFHYRSSAKNHSDNGNNSSSLVCLIDVDGYYGTKFNGMKFASHYIV